MLIQQQRSVSLRDVLHYDLGPLRCQIEDYDSTLRKTQKSKLFKQNSSIYTIM